MPAHRHMMKRTNTRDAPATYIQRDLYLRAGLLIGASAAAGRMLPESERPQRRRNAHEPSC
eukprot:37744-Eustigmatos_ZCMA.PRE.1